MLASPGIRFTATHDVPSGSGGGGFCHPAEQRGYRVRALYTWFVLSASEHWINCWPDYAGGIGYAGETVAPVVSLIVTAVPAGVDSQRPADWRSYPGMVFHRMLPASVAAPPVKVGVEN